MANPSLLFVSSRRVAFWKLAKNRSRFRFHYFAFHDPLLNVDFCFNGWKKSARDRDWRNVWCTEIESLWATLSRETRLLQNPIAKLYIVERTKEFDRKYLKFLDMPKFNVQTSTECEKNETHCLSETFLPLSVTFNSIVICVIASMLKVWRLLWKNNSGISRGWHNTYICSS